MGYGLHCGCWWNSQFPYLHCGCWIGYSAMGIVNPEQLGNGFIIPIPEDKQKKVMEMVKNFKDPEKHPEEFKKAIMKAIK